MTILGKDELRDPVPQPAERRKMKSRMKPRTSLGKWSVGLHTFFLISIIISLILVFGLKVLTFEEGHWWDVTVGLIFPASIAAFITGILAYKKHKDHSILVLISIILGMTVILFLLLHSLFISD